MIARVIVDVPAKQTDRPFDYRIPERLRAWVEIGSRVAVPFGPRLLQGFVIGIADDRESGDMQLKDIADVLDLQPPLSAELVELAIWMSRTYACRAITALQSMVPAALKAKYERKLSLADPAQEADAAWPEPALQAWAMMAGKGGIDAKRLFESVPNVQPYVKQWIRDGLVLERQTVKDRTSAKTLLTVSPLLSAGELREAASQLPAQAAKQKEALLWFGDSTDAIPLKELLERLQCSAGTIRGLERKGFVAIRELEVLRDPYEGREFRPSEPLPLTSQQQAAYDEIAASLRGGSGGTFLLKGVTGSGKTEVYLQAIQLCLDFDKQAIVLVPEIALTPQMVERFKSRFGARVAVLHSRLSNGERYDEWRKIQTGRAQVAVGARSAVFAPFADIGLIIIDEEHESSYKQEESPKYHARDVAIQRAKQHGAAVLLGSATPSLESYEAAADGRSRLIVMDNRVANRPLPAVRLVDMRAELSSGNRSMFSRPLFEALKLRIERGEQTILLLNRRGYSTFVLCRSCGYTVQCPHCDIALTYHKHSKSMRCHYCGYAEREPNVCPECGSEHIRYFGTGTQRVEEELYKLLPGIRIIRMDVDTTAHKGAHEKWLTQFRNGEAEVLLGTQMVAKGLDFPNVTLVGVIAADTVLNLPDFRAAERTFQLLTQVAGRAGRHEKPGEVYIQTYHPDHYSIEAAQRHDFDGFASLELEHRRKLGYPPFRRLILLTFSHEQMQAVVRSGEYLASRLKERLGRGIAEVLGPVASPIPRIKDRYRYQCLIKYRQDASVIETVKELLDEFESSPVHRAVTVQVDVDPQMLM